MTSRYRPTKEIAAEVRQQLEAELPDWRFSVTTKTFTGGASICVRLMAGPLPVLEGGAGHAQLNHYSFLQPHFPGRIERISNGHRLTEAGWRILEHATKILASHHWDESNVQADYFHCNFYINMGVGRWNRPYQVNPNGRAEDEC